YHRACVHRRPRFFFSSRRRHTISKRDWSSDVCSSDLQFNETIKNVPNIPYYSYSSAVGKGTSDPIKVMSRYQNSYIYEEEGLNDGMVSVESAKWGQHIKTANLAHMEQMNQIGRASCRERG